MTAEKATLVIATISRPTLARTVRTACAGTGADVLAEVVVLDNSDGLLDRAEVVAAASPVPCRILAGARAVRGGRNRLVDAARTDLVCCTDDDCLAEPGWAAVLVDFMAAHPEVAAGFGRVEPVPRPDARTRVVPIDGVGEVAWAEADGPNGPVWCPAISVPSWTAGIVRDPPTVPWARVGSSNSMILRRSRLLPDRPTFLPSLGPGGPAGSGEDTELGYALMAAGRPIAYLPDSRMLHDSWLDGATALRKRRGYFRGNTEALSHHALRGDSRAAELLFTYWRHFCEVNGFAGTEQVLSWAYGPAGAVDPDR